MSGTKHHDHDDLLPALPGVFGRHEDYPSDLDGSRIIRFGTFADSDVEGGGLVIDYVPPDSNQIKRVILAFNDNGMWVESAKNLSL